MMENKKSLFPLAFLLIIVWIICIGSSIVFFCAHLRYPEDLFPLLAIFIMIGTGLILSFISGVLWNLLGQNQKRFEEGRTLVKDSFPELYMDSSVPLYINKENIYINRGFRTQIIRLSDVYWIDSFSILAKYGGNGMGVHFHFSSGKSSSCSFTYPYKNSVIKIIKNMLHTHPDILCSGEFGQISKKECKKIYKKKCRSIKNSR